ncbi:MAG: Tryptophan synthase alpha chain [Dehalococcoidia bacterium]|nr:Tryptophan synthase alpha chain [Dehalococcoidia bacterium]
MSRIAAAFSKAGHKALIAYVTVGYPSIETTIEIVPQLASWGCDIVELGIPFSDPMADGITIQEASFQALNRGVTTRSCLQVASQLRKKVDIPLVFMTYFNPVMQYGTEAFCKSAVEAGVDGLIVPDLPPEEGGELEEKTRGHNLDLIYLLAPTSTEERISLVARRSRGFIYLVSLTGVTGARASLSEDLEDFVARVRSKARQPLCVGFGISTAEQAKRVAKVADGVIVGSKILQLLADKQPARLRTFIEAMRAALE